MRTEYEDVEDKVNVMDQEDDYSEEEKAPTAAYVNCSIDGKIFEAIVDTGAGVNIMSEDTMHRLGYFIDEPTKRTVITVNGESVTPLGRLKDVPITFGDMTICSNFTVMTGG